VGALFKNTYVIVFIEFRELTGFDKFLDLASHWSLKVSFHCQTNST
jgi:hypothetical protein